VAETVSRLRGVNLAKAGRQGDEFEHTLAKWTCFGVKKRMRLYQRLYRFTEQGISASKAFQMIWTRYHRTKDPRRAAFRRMIEASTSLGHSVSEAMSPYIPSHERLLIYAGEDANQLPQGFEKARYVAGALREMKSTLYKNLAYPALLFLMLAGLLYGLGSYAMPTMLKMAPLEKWPKLSKGVYYVGDIVQHAGIFLLAGAIIGTIVIIKTLPKWRGPTREFLDQWLPPWTIHRQYQSAIFLISMAALTEAGRPVEASIRQLNQIANPWLRRHLSEINQRLLAGEIPGRAFNTGFVDRETCGDLEDYSNAGGLEKALHQIGKDTIEDAVEKIAKATRTLNGIMILAVAACIALIYGGIMLLSLEIAHGLNTTM